MAYIKKEFAESLLEKADIVDIISDYTALEQKGATLFGLSPFQKEKSPSFNVNKVKQRFTCYSSGKSGNVITFLMEHNKMTYPEALEEIAKKYGIPVEYADEKQAAAAAIKAEKKKQLRPILETSLALYQKAFASLPEDHPAKADVIGKRQYTNDVILDWQIAFAPGNDFATKHFSPEELVLSKEIKFTNGKNLDKFYNRILYPIHDINGLLVGFGGRHAGAEDKKYAKWVNSDESDIYRKSKVWFGLNRALRAIINSGEANIVEGYNDVIAWHENGLQNTIASSGTSITEEQINILAKYTKRINFTFDDDGAGKKAMLRYIPVFLAAGFTVNVQKTNGADPDDFVRNHKEELENQKNKFTEIQTFTNDKEPSEVELELRTKWEKVSSAEIEQIKNSKDSPEKHALTKVLEEVGEKVDGFKILLEEDLKGNAVEKSKAAYKICETIAKIPDEPIQEIYIPWLKKESGVSLAKIKEWVKQASAKFDAEKLAKEKASGYLSYNGASADDDYTLPESITKTWEEVKNDVYTYSLFESDNKVWSRKGNAGEYTFKAITNCSVQIIQHMSDEEYPMKLIKIKNVMGLEKIFDAPSVDVDTQARFTTLLSNNGNFIYTGDSREFVNLKRYLFDKMGVGRKIEVLYHQPENFWVWNNLVQLYDGTEIPIDENGLFIHDKVSYYVPSANKIYRKNAFKYESQKKASVFEAKVTFKTLTAKAMQVHREHAISGVLFAVASIFQDIVFRNIKNFPILFLYGPGGSGKDQVAEFVQSFLGLPQQAQNLEGGASTMKAKIIKLAQFCNGMAEFSEYKRGDDKVDGILKGIWDRNGYERGNLTSKIGLESVPVLSSLILTGNDYPSQEPLIQRLFVNEINKNEFTEEESKNYDEFKDMCSTGFSSFTVDIIKHRETFKEQFKAKFRGFRKSFQERVPDAKARMISNASVFGATYEIFKDKLDFPFSFSEMEAHFIKCIEQQSRKLQSESIINKWWDCFLYGIKSPEVMKLVLREDFKLEGRALSFHFNQVFIKMSQLWFVIHKEAIPGKTFLMDQLKSSDAFITYHSKGLKMDAGRDVKTSSGYEMDLEKTGLYNEIYDAIQYQLSAHYSKEDSLKFPPATPINETIPEDENSGFGDLLENNIIEENN